MSYSNTSRMISCASRLLETPLILTWRLCIVVWDNGSLRVNGTRSRLLCYSGFSLSTKHGHCNDSVIGKEIFWKGHFAMFGQIEGAISHTANVNFEKYMGPFFIKMRRGHMAPAFPNHCSMLKVSIGLPDFDQNNIISLYVWLAGLVPQNF